MPARASSIAAARPPNPAPMMAIRGCILMADEATGAPGLRPCPRGTAPCHLGTRVTLASECVPAIGAGGRSRPALEGAGEAGGIVVAESTGGLVDGETRRREELDGERLADLFGQRAEAGALVVEVAP